MDAAALTDLADEAVLAAAITCTRPGADPPTAADLRGAARPGGIGPVAGGLRPLP
jgi:hypothetical protein